MLLAQNLYGIETVSQTSVELTGCDFLKLETFQDSYIANTAVLAIFV